MGWETNRLLEKKHCPLFRLRLQPLIKYYKLLTNLVISFQSNGITVRKLLSPPSGEEGSAPKVHQDSQIDAGCFQNVCKRLGCQHCYDSFTDEEFVEASLLLRRDKRRKVRAGSRTKRKSTEEKFGPNAENR